MTISLGTPFQYESGVPSFCSIDRLSDTHAIGLYYDTGNNDRPTAVVITSSGTAGTPVEVFADNTSRVPYVTALTSSTALAVWRASTGRIRARVLSISGTTITTPGTVYTSTFNILSSNPVCLVMMTSTTCLFVYVASTGSARNAMIISVAGTVVTFGTQLSNWAPGTWSHLDITALSSTKALVVYNNAAGSNAGTATILNVSGATVTDGGVDTVFEATATTRVSAVNKTTTSAVISYLDSSTNLKSEIITVSGNTPTSNTALTVDSSVSNQDTDTVIFSGTEAAVFYNKSPNVECAQLDISGTTVTSSSSDSYTGSNTFSAAIALDTAIAVAMYNSGSDGDAVLINFAGGTHLWLSTDGGATYTDIGDSAWGASVVGGVVVVPGTGYQTIFAAVGTSLYKTVNGGTAWTLETAVGYECDFIDLEKDNATVILANRASGGNRASLWDSVGASLSHINTGKSTTGGATSGGDVV